MAKLNTSEALTTLMSLKPTSALLLTPQGNSAGADEKEAVSYTEREVDANDLQKGDLVKVLRGGKVPADGVVAWGEASVDESMLTGESMPVSKRVGDRVIGSTILQEGLVHVRVTHVGEESTLSQILTLMEDAVATKAPIQDYADAVRLASLPASFSWSLLTLVRHVSQLSGKLVPFVVLASLVTFVVWYMVVSFASLPADYIPENQTDFLFAFGFALAVMGNFCRSLSFLR
jgi:Cu+-exporting ATPase